MPPDDSEPPLLPPPPAGKLQRILAALHSGRHWARRDAREHFWDGLDFLDRRPRLRRALYVGVPLAVLLAAAGAWGYSHWSRTHAIAIGRQWLAAGRLDRAAGAARNALNAAPDDPAAWQFAAVVAWQSGMRAQAVNDLRTVASLTHNEPEAVTAWAEGAILSDDSAEADRALSLLPPEESIRSPRAERTKGEWFRRKGDFGAAAHLFQNALDLDRSVPGSSLAIDEIPLGVTLLSTGQPGDRARGLGLLGQWVADPNWGAQALRELLADAIRQDDHPAMARWAQALRRHPRFSQEDIFACLRATAAADPGQFQPLLFSLQMASGTNPQKIAQLMGSLNRLGHTANTLAWAKIIPSKVALRPPIATETAEALRLGAQWRELVAFAGRGEWGRNLEFLSALYDLIAAKHLGDAAMAADEWKSIQSLSRWDGSHALVIADLLYSWGDDDDAINILWSASDSGIAVPALATLARIYQVKRDGAGQYRVFARLESVRPNDRDIGNDFAYFAAVTGHASETAVTRIAQSNFEFMPENIYYRCTWAFVLATLSRPREAERVLAPVVDDWKTSRAIAWADVATLAALGRKDEAKEILRSGPIQPSALSFQEIDWIRAALK